MVKCERWSTLLLFCLFRVSHWGTADRDRWVYDPQWQTGERPTLVAWNPEHVGSVSIRCPLVTFQVKAVRAFPLWLKTHTHTYPPTDWSQRTFQSPLGFSVSAHPGEAFSSFACCCTISCCLIQAFFMRSPGVLTQRWRQEAVGLVAFWLQCQLLKM